MLEDLKTKQKSTAQALQPNPHTVDPENPKRKDIIDNRDITDNHKHNNNCNS